MTTTIFKTVNDLPLAEQRTGAELFEVIQNGVSRKMSLGKVDDLDDAGIKTGAELIEVMQDGARRKMTLEKAGAFDRYDLSITTTTGVIDVAQSQNYKIDNTTTGTRTVTISGAPANRALPVVINVLGKDGTIQWPGSISWNESKAPELGVTSTMVVLFWDGSGYTGIQGATI